MHGSQGSGSVDPRDGASTPAVNSGEVAADPVPAPTAEAKELCRDFDTFDPVAYRDDFFDELRRSEEAKQRQLIQWIDQVKKEDPNIARLVEVGTGPSLQSVLAVLHHVTLIDLVEPAWPNVQYLTEQIHRFDVQANKRWVDLSARNGVEVDPERLRQIVGVRQMSVLDLPEGMWDVLLSSYCAESWTDDPETVDRSVERMVNAVRPKGWASISFVVGGTGYKAGDKYFVQTKIEDGDLERYKSWLDGGEVNAIDGGDLLRPGITFNTLTGRRPA